MCVDVGNKGAPMMAAMQVGQQPYMATMHAEVPLWHHQGEQQWQQQQQHEQPWGQQLQQASAADDDAVRRRMQMLRLRAELQQERAQTTDVELDMEQARGAAKDLSGQQSVIRARQKDLDKAQQGSSYRTALGGVPAENGHENGHVGAAEPPPPRALRSDLAANHAAQDDNGSGSDAAAARRPSEPMQAWGYEEVAEHGGTGEVLWKRPETTAVGWHWLTERQRNNMRRAQERLEAREILAERDAAAEGFLRRMPGPGHPVGSHRDNIRDGLRHPAELYGIGRWRRGEDAAEHRGVQEMLAPPMRNAGKGDPARDAAREAEVAAWERLYEQPRTTTQARATAAAWAHERTLMDEEWASLRRRKLHLLRSGIQGSAARKGDVQESLALGKVWVGHLAEELESTKLRLAKEKRREHEVKQAEEFRVQLERQQGASADSVEIDANLRASGRGASSGSGGKQQTGGSRSRQNSLKKAYIKHAGRAASGTSRGRDKGRAGADRARGGHKQKEGGWRSFDMSGPPL
jgi:hypothetical protein